MAKYKDPLSKNPYNCLSHGFKGAQNCDVNELVRQLIASVPAQVEADYGIKVAAKPETITIGGLLSKQDQPGIIFSFPDKPKYAQILVGFNKMGGMLDVEGVQYGTVSKNMQHANMAEMDHGFSLGGMAKAALHKAMTDSNAVEEERMHYTSLLTVLEEIVQSWIA